MVAGARRDHQHRDIPPGGDARDESLGSVAACHPEQVGAGVYRLARQGGYVHHFGTFEQGHLGTERDGLVPEPELRHLPPARPGVHDHKGLPLWRRRIFARFRRGAATGQCRASRGHSPCREHDAERDLPQQPGDDVHHDHGHRRGDQDHAREPAHDPAVRQEPVLGDAAQQDRGDVRGQAGDGDGEADPLPAPGGAPGGARRVCAGPARPARRGRLGRGRGVRQAARGCAAAAGRADRDRLGLGLGRRPPW